MKKWSFKPAEFVPFQDMKAIEKVIKIKKEDIAKHANPDFRITVLPGEEMAFRWTIDVFQRIWQSSQEGKPFVMITPNPVRRYMKVAYMINKFRVNCSHLHTFNMDEYANEQGQTPPESWEFGFMHAFKKYFWSQIDADLRQPEKQAHGPTTKNIKDYGKMIADMGGADICYSGPGWSGHVAFVEPDAPEFQAKTVKEFMAMGPRICKLSPLTIAQNSLHGSFGASGNLCAVPPYAATIGPAEVVGAKHRVDLHGLTINGAFASWQRLMTRLCLHGPVSPKLPTSINQLLRTDVFVSQLIAEDVKPRWEIEY